jgi:hypothetical protein
MKNFPKINLV